MPEIIGEWPACIKALLLELFRREDIEYSGVLVPSLGVILYFQMGVFLGGESGLHSIWSSKGASGLRPCFLCRNVVAKPNHGFGLVAHDTTGTLVDIRVKNEAAMQLHTDESIMRNARTLNEQRSVLRAADFADLEKAMGLNWNPLGLLCDSTLQDFIKPATWSMYDPMHVFFSNGLCSEELKLLLTSLRDIGISFDLIATWLKSDLQCPAFQRHKFKGLAAFFSPQRYRIFTRSGSFAIGATECVSLMVVLRHWLSVTDMVTRLPLQVASFNALADVVAVLLRIKHAGGQDLVPSLRRALEIQADAFDAAYGTENRIPKFHFARHVCQAIQKHGALLDCFTTERKHSLVKAVAVSVTKLAAFEKTVLSRVILQHVGRLCSSFRSDGLIGGKPADSDLGLGWHVSKKMQWRGFQLSAGDLIMLAGPTKTLVRICACLSHGEELHVICLQGARIAENTWRLADTYSTASMQQEWYTPAFWYDRLPDLLVVVEE